jgi:predicted metalloendopeptidase
VPGGVFVLDGDAPHSFAAIPPPRDEDVAAILERVVRRTAKVLLGFDEEVESEADALAALQAAEVDRRLRFPDEVRHRPKEVTMIRIHALALFVAGSAVAAEPAPPAAERGAATAESKRPLKALPYTPGLDLSAMDRTADPCVDFFAYACGSWTKKNPIPADQAAWSVYAKLQDENEQFLWGILDEAARLPDGGRTPAQRRVGDYFASCMDEPAVEAAGATPLGKDLAAISALRSKADLAKVLGGIDPTLADAGLEWDMTPPTVNAYYNPTLNDMNFPAGVLLPPLFDPSLDLAPGYGNTGGTVGHELVHGFDDEGRNFDAKGNLRDWWTKEDAAAFQERARCVSDQYAQYTVVDEIKINSKLTLGEDIADLAGALAAWDAWKLATVGKTPEARDGLSPEQRFFVGYAQWACGEVRSEALRVRAATDPHSPYWARVNGVFVNVLEFREAFACKVGHPMAPRAEVCRIW